MNWPWRKKEYKGSITLANVEKVWDAVIESAQEDEDVKLQMAQFIPRHKKDPIKEIVNETPE